jgi:hypothetical protein
MEVSTCEWWRLWLTISLKYNLTRLVWWTWSIKLCDHLDHLRSLQAWFRPVMFDYECIRLIKRRSFSPWTPLERRICCKCLQRALETRMTAHRKYWISDPCTSGSRTWGCADVFKVIGIENFGCFENYTTKNTPSSITHRAMDFWLMITRNKTFRTEKRRQSKQMILGANIFLKDSYPAPLPSSLHYTRKIVNTTAPCTVLWLFGPLPDRNFIQKY